MKSANSRMAAGHPVNQEKGIRMRFFGCQNLIRTDGSVHMAVAIIEDKVLFPAPAVKYSVPDAHPE